jgi:radical SAM superfamily enzyme YgiQ (UPF0313 family)
MSSPIKKNILLVNPWIHDFSAYDLWMKPLGLLYIGAILRSLGFEIFLLDCTGFPFLPEKFTENLKSPKRRDFGRGHFYKEVIPKPEILKKIPRQFRRYGSPPEAVKRYIRTLPRPDLILVTSSMTYWHTGVAETISFLRRHIPGAPIYLGGIYATLCPDHARAHSGADQVLPGPWDSEKIQKIAAALGGPGDFREIDFPAWPYPAFDLYPRREYVCLLTRCGCPFTCSYCASSQLMKKMEVRTPEQVVKEIDHWQREFGIRNFAFYDDALLMNSSSHIKPILREVIQRRSQCNFHTPNALHIKMIDEEMADLLFRSGFKTIRLGLETADATAQRETGGKVSNPEFQTAIRNLKKAGYRGEELGVYLLAGLPGQRVEEIDASIAYVREAEARPVLVEYSPIPGTPLFGEAKKISPFDLEGEPLFHNNSLFPCRWEGFTWEDYRRLKERIRE